MEKTNYKQLIQQRQTKLREMICQLTGFTAYQVNELIFDMGCDYIARTSHDDAISEAFIREAMYWNWYRAQWALIDECYWHKYGANIDRDNVRSMLQRKYVELHNRIDAYPDKIVYEKIHNSYMHATQNIIKKHQKESTE